MRGKIKVWLQKILGITQLQEALEIKKMELEYVKRQVNILEEHIKVGADVDTYTNESWAVICIHGKPNYVKFVDLRGRDMREFQRFITQFERNSLTIDSPYPQHRFTNKFNKY